MLCVGLAGSLFVGLSAQFPSTNITDLQGALSSTPDETSWLLTSYTMASLVGVVTSGLLIRTLSVGRYMVGNAVVFTATALACAMRPDLDLMVALRAIQGFAAGAFGPSAFVAAFMVAGPGGPQLPLALTSLSFVLLLPGTLGPVVSGVIEDSFGWRALFMLQAALGGALALASHAWVPSKKVDWSGLRTDWAAVILLCIAVSTLTLVLSQGTRRFWFESDMIIWTTAACMGASAGFLFLARHSPVPIMAPRLLLIRTFGIPISLNMVFRAGLVVTTYLMPQFLAVAHGYRPLEVAQLMLWAAIAQVLALPLAWRMMHLVDRRAIMALGLAFCAGASTLAAGVTGDAASDQFRLMLVLFGSGQVLFLAPTLVTGASVLKFPDLPTASVLFNLATLGGTTLGVGLMTHFATERQKFHSSILTEKVSLYGSVGVERISGLVNALAYRTTDEAQVTTQAVALIAGATRREAWVLAFSDAFLVAAVLLAVTAVATVAIGRAPPLAYRGIVPGDNA